MRPNELNDVAQRLALTITRLRTRLSQESDSDLEGTGLSIPTLMVLHLIVSEGPITAAQLAVVQHVSPQSIAQNLASLKANGLVQSETDPTDTRKILITADESGRQLHARLTDSRQSFLAQAIDASVPPEDREALDRAIELLERIAMVDLGRNRGIGNPRP